MEHMGLSQGQEVCMICGRDELDGIMICEQLICDECEKEIVRTDVKEERYHYFVDQMKKIWFRKTS